MEALHQTGQPSVGGLWPFAPLLTRLSPVLPPPLIKSALDPITSKGENTKIFRLSTCTLLPVKDIQGNIQTLRSLPRSNSKWMEKDKSVTQILFKVLPRRRALQGNRKSDFCFQNLVVTVFQL